MSDKALSLNAFIMLGNDRERLIRSFQDYDGDFPSYIKESADKLVSYAGDVIRGDFSRFEAARTAGLAIVEDRSDVADES